MAEIFKFFTGGVKALSTPARKEEDEQPRGRWISSRRRRRRRRKGDDFGLTYPLPSFSFSFLFSFSLVHLVE
jgi:hypothetical protein